MAYQGRWVGRWLGLLLSLLHSLRETRRGILRLLFPFRNAFLPSYSSFLCLLTATSFLSTGCDIACKRFFVPPPLLFLGSLPALPPFRARKAPLPLLGGGYFGPRVTNGFLWGDGLNWGGEKKTYRGHFITP